MKNKFTIPCHTIVSLLLDDGWHICRPRRRCSDWDWVQDFLHSENEHIRYNERWQQGKTWGRLCLFILGECSQIVCGSVSANRMRIIDFDYKTRITICNEVAVRDTRNSTSANLLTLPYASLDIFKNSLAYRGQFIWNDLPHDIRKCATLSCFKTALKAYILNVWYVITTMFTHFSKIQLYIVIFRCLCQFYWHFIYFIIDFTVYVIYTLTCCM